MVDNWWYKLEIGEPKVEYLLRPLVRRERVALKMSLVGGDSFDRAVIAEQFYNNCVIEKKNEEQLSESQIDTVHMALFQEYCEKSNLTKAQEKN